MARHRGSAAQRRGWTTAYVVAALLGLTGPAAAQSTDPGSSGTTGSSRATNPSGGTTDSSGGTSPATAHAPRLGPPPPGVVVRPAPAVRSWSCLRDCASATVARPGSVVRLRGRGLRPAAEVVFEGAPGEADDVAAAPYRRRRHRLDVRVPLGAAPGPVAVAVRDGRRSAPAGAVSIEPAAAAAGARPAVEVQAQAPRAFYDAARPVAATYVVHGEPAAHVVVELVRQRDGAIVSRWEAFGVPADVPQTLTWDGTAGGRVQPQGRYAFRAWAQSAGGVQAVSAQAPPDDPAPDPAEFVFLRHVFPVRGPHGYGEFAASFGGGRGHQGHDVFAACGTPLVAARGGTVKVRQYHGRAGHYVVIDGERTGIDYAYMHLREPALVRVGDRVRTGQPLGYVGDSGSASGCHLHLELWSAPGWYSGGRPFDPLPSLQAWDKRS
jgi:murein DD-endopeptidase MepM/ murein hydrolase activator NlpD